MGRKDKFRSKDLHQQAYERLTSMQAFGESKKKAKQKGTDREKIYSISTYRTYWKHTKYFLHWIKETYPQCSTLKSARRHVNEWLTLRTERIDKNGNHLSSWTIQTEAAALNKLFGIPPDDPNRFVPPKRERCEIIRSRGRTARDRHFSTTNNDELIRFCKGTGCRRNVLERLEGRDLWTRERMETELTVLRSKMNLTTKEITHINTLKEALTVFPDQDYFVHHRKDKGGRYRFAPIIGKDKDMIIDRFNKIGEREKVWKYVNNNADVHSYRSEYATDLYRIYARDVKDIPYDRTNKGTGKKFQSEVYTCRKDERGKKLDRVAMYICSKALGHNRVNVVADNYLRGI